MAIGLEDVSANSISDTQVTHNGVGLQIYNMFMSEVKRPDTFPMFLVLRFIMLTPRWLQIHISQKLMRGNLFIYYFSVFF